MRPPILIGEHELTLDEKNRLLIPVDIRRSVPSEMGDSFYLVMGINRVPWLYCEKYYEDLVAQVPSDLIPGYDALAYDQLVFGMAARLTWDKAGRVLLPERTVKRAALGKEVVLVGVRDHMELYPRSLWQTRQQELEQRSLEVFERARQARQRSTVFTTIV